MGHSVLHLHGSKPGAALFRIAAVSPTRLKQLAAAPLTVAVGDFRSLRSGLLEGSRSDAAIPPGPASRVARDAPPTSRTQPYEVLHAGPTDLIASVGPCLIVISHTITLDGVAAIGRGLAKLTQRYEKACSVSFVERKSGPGTAPEARQAIAEIAHEYDKHISGAAVVCDGTGFRATAVRSVVTAINMASRASHPSKVFATGDLALQWLQSLHLEGDFDLSLVTQATVALRARLQPAVEPVTSLRGE
jgi:hypothetical protein